MARTEQTAPKVVDEYSSESEEECEDSEDAGVQAEDAEDVDPYTEEEKAKQAELEKAPMQAELKHLEKRWTKKGRAYLCEPKEDEEIPEQKINWYEKFALCVTRTYSSDNKYVTQTALQINSPTLKRILADKINSFPGESFHTGDVSIDFPARVLYHYRPELLAALAEQEPGSEGAAHLPILLAFIDEHHGDTIKNAANLREQGLVNYELLWTIFRPGDLVFGYNRGQPCMYQLKSYSYNCGQNPGLDLQCEYIDFDGDNFGKRDTWLFVSAFRGAKPIADLDALPLQFHPAKEEIAARLVERGRRWEALAGQNFREYKGMAMEGQGCDASRYNIDGRVMIDVKTFHRIQGNSAFWVRALPKKKKIDREEEDGASKRRSVGSADDWDLVVEEQEEKEVKHDPLSDENCMLASPLVRGYSFTEKKFLDFFVDKVRPVEWNTECFDQLVLPAEKKELVQALVAEHTQRSRTPSGKSFDDIVKGKGRGLILVLHGPPGVGKTLTAECVAEFAHRPLYIVSSGDLGTNSRDLDQQLRRVLDLASTWKAVLLIDEADVFLERRSLHDMERNSLVSIFLRTLEYYSGILFMTTNRVRTFDDAFKSRIHVPLKYEELPAESRIKVWKNFLRHMEEDGTVEIDEKGYRQLAEGQLNGRQIKNVVRTAKSLATYKRRKLDHAQLQQVMDIQMAFEEELNSTTEEDIDKVET